MCARSHAQLKFCISPLKLCNCYEGTGKVFYRYYQLQLPKRRALLPNKSNIFNKILDNDHMNSFVYFNTVKEFLSLKTLHKKTTQKTIHADDTIPRKLRYNLYSFKIIFDCC